MELDIDLLDRWLRAKAEIDEMQTLRNEIKALNEKLLEDDPAVVALEKRVAELESTIEGHLSTISELEAEVLDLESIITGMRDEMAVFR